MKKYETRQLPNGTAQRVPKDLIKSLNLHYLRYTNQTYAVGKHDLPALYCNTEVYPDYIALYSQRCDYHKTPNTAVAFYQYDNTFDGQNGLYNAIYYNNEKQLAQFKERFKGVRFFISPDYSELGDIDDIENNYRIKKARVVSIWLMTELSAIVIPHITFPTISTIDFYLDGLEDCSVVAFSTKGYVDDKLEREILVEAVKYTVDRLKLKTIIVYDVCRENKEAEDIFRYAADKGINIIIPPNMIKNRNQARRKKNASK